jgi:choline dehydrogenase-like flavoprotein
MIIDARSLPDRTVLQADVCIAGAGAAGIALAREFLTTGIKVLLLEGGDLKFSHHNQFMYRGESTGRDYLPLEFTRRRQFGGTTVTWSGRCRPLDEIDFEARPWIAHSGWPFSKKDLDPYYERAHAVCQLGPCDYSPAAWQSEAPAKTNDSLEVKIFQFSPPTDFGAAYRSELERASNVQVFLNANVVRIELDPDGRSVSRLECRSGRGRGFQTAARVFILAAGGLEVPRLLLASRAGRPAGIGNENDLVGRFFMDHPYLTIGVATVVPDALPPTFLKVNFEIEQKNLGALASLGLRQQTMRAEGLLNGGVTLVKRPAYKLEDAYFTRAMADFMQVNDILRHASAPSVRIFQAAAKTVLQAGRIAPTIGRGLRHKSSPAHGWGLRLQLETIPNPESRVTLSEKRDSLGIPRLHLNWQVTGQDLENYHRFETLIFKGLPQWGIQARRFRHDLDADGWPVTLQVGKHHIGTTRMHADPRRGVVDADCRVHSTANLFVAGSSVFPTSGMANPTLTIVALAIRLADRIKKDLGV